MKPTLNEKFIAYLALLSGLSISAVAVYYSVVGLTAIFAAAVVPIVIMGTTLEISKLVATVWLKQNWKTAPLLIKTYLFAAIIVLMVITSMGIFGFLSKAHSDQNLVSGDVLAKIAVYDEKIKTSKENIDANRKQLKQMDEAVDQVMARSDSEKGAEKSVALRRSQSKDRARLLQDIEAEQKTISSLNEERAPIAAEVRKVEAEVGPIKYIAAFFYGSTDTSILEKAVTWVIITLIVVFDPLAVILLLASQMSFQEFREREGKTGVLKDSNGTIVGLKMPKKEVEEEHPPYYVADVGEKPTVEELKEINEPVVEKPKGTEFEPISCSKCGTELVDAPNIGLHCPNHECGVIKEAIEETEIVPQIEQVIQPVKDGYVQNEEQKESSVWSNTITQTEYLEVGEERKREVIVNQWVNRVRNNEVSMHHVPVDIVEEVRARL